MVDTWPLATGEVGREKNGAFGSFNRVLLVLTLLKSSYGKGLFWG